MTNCVRAMAWLAVLVAVTPAFALTPIHLWSRGFGDIYYDEFYDVAVDGMGNVLLVGFFSQTVDFGGGPLVSAGSFDIFVAKYSASGVHQWSKRFGSGTFDSANRVAVDNVGNVFVTGYFRGTVDFGGGPLVCAGLDDAFLLKLSPAGVYQWAKRFGATGYDEAGPVAVDGSGNVVVSGGFNGIVNFGGGPLVSVGGFDGFLARYDASGVHLWSKRFGNASDNGGLNIAVDVTGNVSGAGGFSGSVDYGGGNFVSAGGVDVVVARYDANGVHQWSQRFGSTLFDSAYEVAMDAAGNVATAGVFEGVVNFGAGGLTSAGGRDIFLARYDAMGAPLWSGSYGGAGNDEAYGMAADASGEMVVVGLFSQTVNFGGGALVSAGGSDAFIARFTPNGAGMWSNRFGDAAFQLFSGVALDAAGDAFVAGTFEGTMNLGGGDLTSAGDVDGVLAKFGDLPSGVEDTPRAGLSLSVYPNPFNPGTTVRYTIPARGRTTVVVYDARGARLATLVDEEQEAGTYSTVWNGRDDAGREMSSGVYFARVSHPSGSYTQKSVFLK